MLGMPQAMLNEMVSEARRVGQDFGKRFSELEDSVAKCRHDLEQATGRGRLCTEAQLKDFDEMEPPTVCGVDGTHVRERMLSRDIVAVAAVAVEGITPPKEKRLWETPRHKLIVIDDANHQNIHDIRDGLMTGWEMTLASDAPHKLVMIDNSLLTPAIQINNAVYSAMNTMDKLSIARKFGDNLKGFLKCFAKAVSNSGTGTLYLAVPKTSQRRELGYKFGWKEDYNERALLSLVLQEGEFTYPIEMGRSTKNHGGNTLFEGDWSAAIELLAHNGETLEPEVIETIEDGLDNVYVSYYKPARFLPCFRLEMAKASADNVHRFAEILKCVKHQTVAPGIIEPFPLFLADTMARTMNRSMQFIRSSIVHSSIRDYAGDMDGILLMLQHYRTMRAAGRTTI